MLLAECLLAALQCRPGPSRPARVHARYVGQLTPVLSARGQTFAARSRTLVAAGLSRVSCPGRRMIEHDCNPAARQAGYPVGEEHDPDPPALEHGAGRDLTCQPYPGATATLCELTGRTLVLWGLRPSKGHWPIRHPCDQRPPAGRAAASKSVSRKTPLAAAKLSDLARSKGLEPPTFKSVGMSRPSRTVQPWLHARSMFQVRSGCDPATGVRHMSAS